MPTTSNDLWPDDIAVTDVVTPVNILKEQASMLGAKTKNLVQGEIVQRITRREGESPDSFIFSFNLKAPALQNYKYQLFWVTYPITFYPLTIHKGGADSDITVNSQDELVDELRNIFSHEKTKNVIHALIAQSSK